MKRKMIRITAGLLLFVLLTFTGCSAVGGFSCSINNCAGCVFEDLGCLSDCVLYANPIYCLFVAGPNDCDLVWETCLVTPFFACAEDNYGSLDKDPAPSVRLLNTGDTFFDSEYGGEETDYEWLPIYPSVGSSKETSVSCDGDYARLETEIHIENQSFYRIEEAYIVIQTAAYRRQYEIGTILPNDYATVVHFEYHREGSAIYESGGEEVTISQGENTGYAIYGKVIETEFPY